MAALHGSQHDDTRVSIRFKMQSQAVQYQLHTLRFSVTRYKSSQTR